MPKPASGARISTSSGRMPSGPATFAASQAVMSPRDRDDTPPTGLAARVGAGGAGSPDGDSTTAWRVHSATVSSVPARKASRQAWRWTFPLEVRGKLVGLISRIAETSTSSASATPRRIAASDLLGDPRGEPALGLDDDRQPLLAGALDREGRGSADPEGGVAPLGRPLDILRIDIPAPQDDHVLDPARDEQLAVAQEAEVPVRRNVRPSCPARRPSIESRLSSGRPQ